MVLNCQLTSVSARSVAAIGVDVSMVGNTTGVGDTEVPQRGPAAEPWWGHGGQNLPEAEASVSTLKQNMSFGEIT